MNSPQEDRQRRSVPEPLVGLEWVWRLRWGAVAGQLATLLVARWLLDIRLRWPWLAAELALIAVSNLLSWRLLSGRTLGRTGIAGLLLADVGVLTALLSGSG